MGKRGCTIWICYGKEDLKKETLEELKKLGSVYFYKDMHSKCFLSESEGIIGSMNLYEASEKNREMAISFNVNEDKQIYEEAKIEAISIIKNAIPINKDVNPSLSNQQNNKIKEEKKHQGYCIRCGYEIRLDECRPFCRDCYEEWSFYENEEYPENYCHCCGRANRTSMDKPLCRDCYRKLYY